MKTKTPDTLLGVEVSRRGLMRTTAIGGLAAAGSAFTLPFSRLVSAADAISPPSTSEKLSGVHVRSTVVADVRYACMSWMAKLNM